MRETSGRKKMDRRRFLAGAAAATVFTIVKPNLVRGTEANSAIALGMIGCGSRGSWLATLFARDGKFRNVACADYFQERADQFGQTWKIDSAHCHNTLSGYKRLLEHDLDAVAVETPGYFHAEQAAGAVEAGKHVYLAKPVSVDVPGCMTINELGVKARERKQVFFVDLQTRANEYYREAVKRVQNGDIGRLVLGEVTYPWYGSTDQGPDGDAENRLRRWYLYVALSGDFIVEQDVHVIDVATWFADSDPISAYGTGGRTVRQCGDCWDHMAITYSFPRDFILNLTNVQCIPGVQDELRCRIFGANGVVDTDYYKGVSIKGQIPYGGGTFESVYATGAQSNIDQFHSLIKNGDCSNTTVAPSVRSTLTCVLGREAAYKGGTVTWREMIQANRKIEADLTGLKS